MNCNDCINHNGRICETMTAPAKDFSCHMTKEDRINAEKAVIQYAATNGAVDTIATSKRIIKRLEKRQI